MAPIIAALIPTLISAFTKENLKRKSTAAAAVIGTVAAVNPEIVSPAVLNPDLQQVVLAIVTIVLFFVQRSK